MHRVRVRAGVAEDDPQPVALVGAQGRAGHAAVDRSRPGKKMPGAISISLSTAIDLEGAQGAAVGQRSRSCRCPSRSAWRRIEAVARVVDLADGDHVAVRHAGHRCRIRIGSHGGHVVTGHGSGAICDRAPLAGTAAPPAAAKASDSNARRDGIDGLLFFVRH